MNKKLEAGQVVDVFTDPLQKKMFEDSATLIEKIENGDEAMALSGSKHAEYWAVEFTDGRSGNPLTRKEARDDAQAFSWKKDCLQSLSAPHR